MIPRSILAFAVVAALATPAGVRAEEKPGCDVTTTGLPGTPGNCRYVAGGPGRFEVRSASGFRISIYDPVKRVWRTAVAQGRRNDPVSAVAVTSGTIPSKPGETVDLAVGIQAQDHPAGAFLYQDGRIEGGDS